jgi:peptidoglycan/xylan/chitin deacetylase (PgdA/CDA1 family)/methionyl-tRNA formyltransferase
MSRSAMVGRGSIKTDHAVKIVILSTDTPHHVYFINRIAERFEIAAIFYETNRVQPKFPTGPLFEEDEALFEKAHFFERVADQIPGSIPLHVVGSVNDPGVDEWIRGYAADIGIVFGCGKIKPHVFTTTKSGLVNVHRGISEKYRGLDSDLWALDADDFDNVGVTLHKVDGELDTGDILKCLRLNLVRHARAHELRYYTTVMAAEAALDMLADFGRTGNLSGRSQKKGDYHSFMPLDLKRRACAKLEGSRPAFDPEYYPSLFNFKKRSRDELAILIYHGVTDSVSGGVENFSGKHMDAAIFERQMRYLAENCRLMSMDEVEEHCRKGCSFPENAVAVTFDDAFENVCTVAHPIMKKYGIPFTFYLTTGFVGMKHLFWVDVVEDCINRSMASDLSLPALNRIFPLRTAQEKIEAIIAIKAFCKKSSPEAKDQILETLVANTGVTPDPGVTANYRMADWRQIGVLARDPGVILGGHTHTHDIMSGLTEERLGDEIRTSITEIENNVNVRIRHYAYPEGQAAHYSQKVIAALKEQGIVCSPSAKVGLNPLGTDPFHLRRIMAGFMGMPFPYWDDALNPSVIA